MDKETLSNYGWIVILVLVLAVMIALATPFGSFIADAVKSTTQGLFDVNQNALNSTGLINIDGQEFDKCDHDYEVTTTTANCTTAGTTTYTCKLCGKSYSEAVSASHTFDNSEDMTCNVCNTRFTSYSFTPDDYDAKMGTTTKTDAVVVIPETFEYDGVNYKVRSIAYRAFDSCDALTSITLPSSVYIIDSFAFEKCTSLTNINLENLTTIGTQVFNSCTSLTTVRLPYGVRLGSYSIFANCTGLTTVYIPSNIGTIPLYCFASCTSLENIIFEGTIAQWNEISFVSGWDYNLAATHIQCSDGVICMTHAGGIATCQNKAVCSACGSEYGSLGTHNSLNGICQTCGTAITVIESEHSPYSNNISNVVLGTWDYSDAQSVTITITYQTENTSFDWVYLKSGDNYIDLDGNVTSTATKIGGTTKTTKTFTTTALTGSAIFRTDGSGNNYYGVHVTVTPNY